ncbi:MAG: hypothetical protein LBD58_00730 [Treponema sp.]|nr:hypothetical protein [Treponema sp.]
MASGAFSSGGRIPESSAITGLKMKTASGYSGPAVVDARVGKAQVR